MQFEIIQKRNSYVSSPSNRHETHQILRVGTLSLLIVFRKDTLSALYQPSKGAISSPVRLRSIQVYRRGERRGRSHASMIYGVRYFGSPQSIAISESSRNRERFRHPIEQNELLETPRGINLTATVPTLREIAPPYRQAWPPTRGLVFVTPPKIIASGARFARENSVPTVYRSSKGFVWRKRTCCTRLCNILWGGLRSSTVGTRELRMRTCSRYLQAWLPFFFFLFFFGGALSTFRNGQGFGSKDFVSFHGVEHGGG